MGLWLLSPPRGHLPFDSLLLVTRELAYSIASTLQRVGLLRQDITIMAAPAVAINLSPADTSSIDPTRFSAYWRS
jgi:hypothetical protein